MLASLSTDESVHVGEAGVGALRTETQEGRGEGGGCSRARDTCGQVRLAWPEEGRAEGAHRKGADMLSVSLKSVLGSQELGPATCRPQGGLALDADWAVSMQPLLTGSTQTPCSQEACNVS